MRIYKLLNKTKMLIIWTVTGLSLAVLLCFPTECRNGAANGVFLCIQVLIPSLFPFIILSAFIAKSGIAATAPKFLSFIMGRVFGLSGNCALVLLLTLIGGYPVGAATIKSLYKEGLISDRAAKRMALFCVASGPGFLVTYIGAAMTRNTKLGYILLASQTVTVVLLGLLARYTVKCEEINAPAAKKTKAANKSIKAALVHSVESSIKACSKMCALVVIFGAIAEVYITLCKGNPSLLWLTALLEITNGTKILCSGYPTVLISAVCGFGGLCVHFQVFSELDKIDFSKSLFYIFRLLQGILNAGITYILLKIFPLTQTVFSSIENAETKFYTTSVGCIVLILVCIAFIISVKNKAYTKQLI